MVNLPSVSSAEVLRVLRKVGFIDAPHRGKGSHVALYHVDQHGRKNLVIVPKRKALPKGTLIGHSEPSRINANGVHPPTKRANP
jgi:predicted RNA binding protein YcfA (HicA-like mRNA interferase family)